MIVLLEDTIRRASDIKVSEALVDSWIESMRAALMEGKRPEVRALLRQYVEKVVVRGNEVDIYYVFGLLDVALLKPHLGKRKLPPTGHLPLPRYFMTEFRIDRVAAPPRVRVEEPRKARVREQVQLYRAMGMSYPDIAQAMNLSVGTVWNYTNGNHKSK